MSSLETISTAGAVSAEPKIPTNPFTIPDYRLLFAVRTLSTGANQALAVAVGWQIYELTGSALYLGLIGLVQFMPPLLLMLAAGQVADRYNRRLILRFCYVLEFCASAGLIVVS